MGRPRKIYTRTDSGQFVQYQGAVTPRELEVLALAWEGLTNPQIGNELGISDETVKRHMSSIFDKFGVDTRTGMLSFAVRRGIIAI